MVFAQVHGWTWWTPWTRWTAWTGTGKGNQVFLPCGFHALGLMLNGVLVVGRDFLACFERAAFLGVTFGIRVVFFLERLAEDRSAVKFGSRIRFGSESWN
jgi:hypothetical protein